MNYRWIEDIEEFKDIAEKWDKALLLSGEDNPFLLSDFIFTWWKYYFQNLKLKIFVLYEENEIIGGLPLCKNTYGYLEHIGGWAANYTEFLSVKKSQAIWDIFFDALKKKKDWQCLRLKRYRKNKINADEKYLMKLCEDMEILFDLFRSDYTYLINIPENFSDLIKYLPKKLRYYVRRSEKEFSKLGEIKLYSLSNYEEVVELADKYIQLSKDSFKKRNRQSAFEETIYCMFFKELVMKFCKLNYLDANALKLDDSVIAIHFGYSIGNNLNYIFPTFDINFANFNPGYLLIYKLLELSSKRGCKVMDLYTGGHLYKEQWSNSKEDVVTIEIRRRNFANFIKRKVISQLRNSPITFYLRNVIGLSPTLMKIGRKIKKYFRKASL